MAKRSGNFSRPADVYASGTSPRALRYALMASALPLAARLQRATRCWRPRPPSSGIGTAVAALDAYTEERPMTTRCRSVLHALAPPSPQAWTMTSTSPRRWPPSFDLVRELNSRVAARSISTADARRGAAAIRELDSCAGGPRRGRRRARRPSSWRCWTPASAARAARDWARSDELRDALAAAGVVVEDTPDGQRWRRS